MAKSSPPSGKALLEQEQEVAELLRRVPAETVGARLSRARKRQGLSIRDLAAAANVNKNSVMRLEKGGLPQPLTVLKICAALGIHIATIANPGQDESEVVAIHRHKDNVWYDMADLAAGPLKDRTTADAPMMILQSRLETGMLMPTLVELNGECVGQAILGEEMVFVLKGTLRIVVGSRSFNLEAGESATFWTSEQHVYGPAEGSPLPVRILSVSVHHRGRNSAQP